MPLHTEIQEWHLPMMSKQWYDERRQFVMRNNDTTIGFKESTSKVSSCLGHIYTIHVKQQQVIFARSRRCTVCDGSRTIQVCYAKYSLFSRHQVFWMCLNHCVYFRIRNECNDRIQRGMLVSMRQHHKALISQSNHSYLWYVHDIKYYWCYRRAASRVR
jgi:hypothetical protein